MKRIALVTSGGDAPGMNAAINATVRNAFAAGMEAFGVRKGYEGLIENDIVPMTLADVEDVIELGGTLLGTARCKRFEQEGARRQGIKNLKHHGIEGLVVIGGNGSQRGAYGLHQLGFPVVGVASTVDNDLYGSDISIGCDTALNTIIESIDRIRTTAESHRRVFLIEVMGRHFGYLAMMAGLASGAEIVITPEYEMDPPEVLDELRRFHRNGRDYALVIVTDGAKNNVAGIHEYLSRSVAYSEFEMRVTMLGHVQRGGAPSTYDRSLAAQLATGAVELLERDDPGKLVGWKQGTLAYTPYEEVVSKKKELDSQLWMLSRRLVEINY
ncbi:MAG: 6-phosphofructokinase [Candidatus Solincola sediminis]|uniref:ATP-dependent 6-phosphofructokinase n=1 Tax=Candidatus Solincola sediminis TaxID=1797199 RepID=A0A1F2WKD0_9ACTN|nr:MAG: 6-phosphofructokinase [Candidatus Solincola sediminis]OFW58798.1 MAG: 6-phosphofructokinase [Candidatus Solincola sediminis]